MFSLVSSVLSTRDLLENCEVTNDMYKRLQLLGNDFSKMVSRTYTIADIILPIVRDKKQGVIVSVGLEEHHHPYLARIVLDRMKLKSGSISKSYGFCWKKVLTSSSRHQEGNLLKVIYIQKFLISLNVSIHTLSNFPKYSFIKKSYFYPIIFVKK